MSKPDSPTGTAGLLVIDVRTESEYRASGVEGAVNVPLSELERRIAHVARDKGAPIAVYCASGARSGLACTMLRHLGYANASNAGGLYAAAAALQRGLRF